jgi:hypothetical protein
MYYDTRPQDTENGKTVVDVERNDGTVTRTLMDGTEITFGTKPTLSELVDKFSRV